MQNKKRQGKLAKIFPDNVYDAFIRVRENSNRFLMSGRIVCG
jgi:hypothetical protein